MSTLRLLIRWLELRLERAAWGRVRCTRCGVRRDEVSLRFCEGLTLTVLQTPDKRDPHAWPDRA